MRRGKQKRAKAAQHAISSQSLLEQATALHSRKLLAEAEQVYRALLRQEPDHISARFLFGVLCFERGRAKEALLNFDRVLALAPNHGDALYNRATTLTHLGRDVEACAAYDRVLALEPNAFEAWYNRGIIHFDLKRPAEALADFDRAVALKPDFPLAWNMRGNALRDLRRPKEALESYERAVALAPNYAIALSNLGLPLLEMGRTEEALAQFRRFADTILPNAPAPNEPVPSHKTRHDEEQRAFCGANSFHIEPGARVPGAAVNADRQGINAGWPDAYPQIAVIDDFLSAPALDELRRFCLGSTIWRNVYKGGYLGAFPTDGFACPLLAQIAAEMRTAFPAIFGSHDLHYLWAYKYDSKLNGIKVHADFAYVNVNFWITPDEANLDAHSGGLVIWDKGAPADWDFARYNNVGAPVRAFLDANGAKPVTVPYRANRAVIFDSSLFHETDRMHFREGYENRRINITMLYGRR